MRLCRRCTKAAYISHCIYTRMVMHAPAAALARTIFSPSARVGNEKKCSRKVCHSLKIIINAAAVFFETEEKKIQELVKNYIYPGSAAAAALNEPSVLIFNSASRPYLLSFLPFFPRSLYSRHRV